MTITLKLKPEIEQQLLNQAAAKGLAVETFLEQLIETQLIQSQTSSKELSDEEWEATLMQIGSRQSLRKASLSDEAISRESVYTREDEQL
ncbi:MAG: hypothetical protein LH660_05760 [Phormidesmis sp. CAN_BIN36]|nr:hypothetical protein [Phormidesmis sp. CAN_BIN36]